MKFDLSLDLEKHHKLIDEWKSKGNDISKYIEMLREYRMDNHNVTCDVILFVAKRIEEGLPDATFFLDTETFFDPQTVWLRSFFDLVCGSSDDGIAINRILNWFILEPVIEEHGDDVYSMEESDFDELQTIFNNSLYTDALSERYDEEGLFLINFGELVNGNGYVFEEELEQLKKNIEGFESVYELVKPILSDIYDIFERLHTTFYMMSEELLEVKRNIDKSEYADRLMGMGMNPYKECFGDMKFDYSLKYIEKETGRVELVVSDEMQNVCEDLGIWEKEEVKER